MPWTEEKIRLWKTPAPEVLTLIQRWKEKGFERVLDRGCGPGRHSICLAGQGFSVTAVDRDPAALSYLKRWAQEECLPVTTVAGDILSLPFPDHSFDCVLDYHASFHTDTAGYLRGISELHRVIKLGGEAYVTVKSKNDAVFRSGEPIDRFTVIHENQSPHFYAAESELPALFRGFRILDCREVTAPGVSSPDLRAHFHLLLKKEDREDLDENRLS